MRTTSRSNNTVVVRVSCGKTGLPVTHNAMTDTNNNVVAGFRPRSGLFRCHHIERKCERMNLVVAAKLRPRAVAAGFRHQALERDVRPSAKLLKIGSRWDHKLRRPA